jgi:hypothetical protein
MQLIKKFVIGTLFGFAGISILWDIRKSETDEPPRKAKEENFYYKMSFQEKLEAQPRDESPREATEENFHKMSPRSQKRKLIRVQNMLRNLPKFNTE